MTCRTCGRPTSNRPALCADCRAERAEHHRAKAAARWAALTARTDDDRPACVVCGARLGQAEARAGELCIRCLRIARTEEAAS